MTEPTNPDEAVYDPDSDPSAGRDVPASAVVTGYDLRDQEEADDFEPEVYEDDAKPEGEAAPVPEGTTANPGDDDGGDAA